MFVRLSLLLLGVSTLWALAQSNLLDTQMARWVEALKGWDYTLVEMRNGQLDNGKSQNIFLNLRQNTNYAIVAVCDEDCTDLDLTLFDGNGNKVDQDSHLDDIPLVKVTPRWNGLFRLEVGMSACSVEPCAYRIGVLGRSR